MSVYNVASGISTLGKIKYNLKNKEIFDLSVKAFNKYSNYKNSDINLNYFLQTLSITSSLEGGFDAINTYDKAGLSVGFIQFARPNIDVYNLLSIYNKTLADEVKGAFGTIDSYVDTKSLNARVDSVLLSKVQQSIITPEGIDAQLKLCIQKYYDVAFKKFLTLTFSPENDNSPSSISKKVVYNGNLNVNSNNVFNQSLSTTSTDINPYKIYALAFIFDLGVNQGVGTINGKGKDKVNQISIGGINMTEGNFLNYYVQGPNKIYLLPQRREFWIKVLQENFIQQ
jgi:hypothetical protein